MREILFRGKRVDNGEWVYGDLLHPDNYGNGYSIEDFTKDKNNCFDVIPETVGQYTGLKDKNGKMIFEGDIVICRQEINGNFIDEHIEKGYVEMKQGAFGLHRKQGYYRPFKDWLEDYEYEVIGNILKGGDLDA